MHSLVTGGGGFLGGYIVEALIARGDRVRSFGRGAYPDLEAAGVEVVRGDMRDSAGPREGVRRNRLRLPHRGDSRASDWIAMSYEAVNQHGTELLFRMRGSVA